MGYDIDICEFTIDNNKARRGKTVSTAYLSSNWSDLSRICSQHLFEGECGECWQTDLWYFRNDCHRRRGDDVMNRAQKALNLLSEYGITPGIPDERNDNWGFGLCTTTEGQSQLPPKERLGVFAYHLKRFCDLGRQFPMCFFLGDHDESCDLILPNGTSVSCEGEESDNETDEATGPVTYFRHPFKGNFRVDSFQTAMEVYGLTSAKDDPRAQLWFDLAMQMPDAPGK